MKEDTVFAVFMLLFMVVATAIFVAMNGYKWGADRFDGEGRVVRIVPDDNYPLYLCADVINGKYMNCVSSQQVVEFGREYWVKRGLQAAKK